jgi:hypothetical protein
MDLAKMAGHRMGETFFLELFFKPLVEPSSRSNQQLFSENTSYYLFPPQDRISGRLSLLHTDAYWVHFVYNSGTDML